MDDDKNIVVGSEKIQRRVQAAVDRRRPQTPDTQGRPTRRPRSKSIGANEPSGVLDDHRRARSRQRAGPPAVCPEPVVNQQDNERSLFSPLSTIAPTPAYPEHPRRARSHSRTRSQQVMPASDSSSPPVPDVPQRSKVIKKIAPIPSAIPPGFSSDSFWIRDGYGWPRLQRPEQYPAQDGIYSTTSPLVGQHGQLQPNHGPPPQPPVQCITHLQSDSTRYSRSNAISDHHPSPRSRSHSRPRLEDSSTPTAPDLLLGRESQPNLPKIPSVLPPGYPDGAVWVRETSGRPRVETPEQYRRRYGLRSPAVPPRRQEVPKRVAFQPEAQVFAVQPLPEPEHPSTSASPAPQKPFLTRLFGGIRGSNKHPSPPEAA
ncbi:hypothetical protein DL96DRAFT_553140 [Flagelloscypha sp. PMI_526]|nr:hypothetical protein DL96DRAFT_553140 [Flagelloscypha sp. PMI_526]